MVKLRTPNKSEIIRDSSDTPVNFCGKNSKIVQYNYITAEKIDIKK
jgi:hypothetical protein